MSDQITSSQIIEFFWFFFPFLLFINAILLKFYRNIQSIYLYIKTSIHVNKQENRAKAYSQQQMHDPNKHDIDGLQGQEIQIVGNIEQNQQMNIVDEGQQKQIQQAQQLQSVPQQSTISLNLTQNTRITKVFDGLNEIISTYFPLLSVSIICINNFAAWNWALACVFLFLFFVIAFNIIQVQRNFSDTIKSNLLLQIIKVIFFDFCNILNISKNSIFICKSLINISNLRTQIKLRTDCINNLGFLYVSHHIWLSGLFISYLACRLKLSN